MDMENSEAAAATRYDLRLVKDELKGELKTVKDDLTNVKDDLAHVKEDLTHVKGEVTFVKNDLKAFKRTVALEFDKTNSRIEVFEQNIRGDIRAMESRLVKTFDGFVGGVGKVDRAQVISDWRLTELEKRVKTIESRPS